MQNYFLKKEVKKCFNNRKYEYSEGFRTDLQMFHQLYLQMVQIVHLFHNGDGHFFNHFTGSSHFG